MTSKTDERRNNLRTRLIEIAEEVITAKGLSAIRARDLAKQAGCSVGAIYTVFDDMEKLTMQVNGRTFKRLGAKVAGAIEGMDQAPPTERLIALALAYLDFARENTRTWNALFNLRMSRESEIPAWYLSELTTLFAHISKPVGELRPDLDKNTLILLTRGLFSSVHGIVLLGLQHRISGIPPKDLPKMITLILSNLTQK
ncbi:MAG: TetR/AcrR family transcriptional regulator [Paracoccaceae bacterium]